MRILADGRWSGNNGIGRVSAEILARLKNTDIITEGPKPLSFKNIFWLPAHLRQLKKSYDVFYIPGFMPVLSSPLPFVFSIYDLIHLYYPGRAAFLKKGFYNTYIKYGARKAHKIITTSEYSKKTIVEWANINPEKVVVITCGVSRDFAPEGRRYAPGYPYLLHVGNTKPHKNVPRLLKAFSTARIDKHIRLVLMGKPTNELNDLIQSLHLQERVVFSGILNEAELAEYYRGALAVLFPSLYEGFGLPVLEGMASGVPVLTSDATSLPEVAGDAAILIDPYRTESIADGIETIIHDTALRKTLIEKGLERAALFTWDKGASEVQDALR